MDKQLENIRKWLILGGIGFFAIFVFALMMYKPIANSDHTKIGKNIKSEQKRNTAEPHPDNKNIESEGNTAEQAITIKIDMVLVEGGVFTMGSTDIIEERMSKYPVYYRSKPAHEVTVSSFYIGKYEITQAQWQAVMGSTIKQQQAKTGAPGALNGIHGEGDNYPMYFVSWNEAQEFIRRLNAGTGKKYRLPTEAEWEYAARGGNQSQGYKYSGSNNLDDVAWYNLNSGGSSHPVGTKQPNELGIYDMSGNLREWCNDFGGYAYTSLPQRDPTGPSSGKEHATRNGSWWNNEYVSRAFFRFALVPDNRNRLTGFRVALSL